MKQMLQIRLQSKTFILMEEMTAQVFKASKYRRILSLEVNASGNYKQSKVSVGLTR